MIDKVLRRVAADGEFWKEDDVGFFFARFFNCLQDFGGVAVEVADFGVELR